MGTIKRTNSGRYFASAYGTNGVRYRKTFEKISQAKAFISKIENQKHEENLIDAKMKVRRVTFSSTLENFLITKSHLKKKTVDRYNYIFNRLRLFLANNNITYLDQFTPDHSTQFYKELLANYPDPRDPSKKISPKPKTINHALQIIRSFFNYEVEIGHILRSPMLHIKNQKLSKPHPEFYSEEELKKFFSQPMADEYRFAFIALLHTGMRINELINITWDNVNMEKRLIYVRPEETHTLKTDNAERAIPINDTLYDILEKIIARKRSEHYPFCSINGMKLNQSRLLLECKKIGKSAGIKGRVFLHKFRHTFATHLVKRRVPLEVIQKLLGHASIHQSMVYLHIRSEDLHTDVAVLNNLADQSKDESAS